MNTKQIHQDKFDAQAGEQGLKIDELKSKADKTEAEAKIEYYEQMYLM
ncbi:MAG: hypothetical protein ACXV8O_00120 [Methylobacter sp.]